MYPELNWWIFQSAQYFTSSETWNKLGSNTIANSDLYPIRFVLRIVSCFRFASCYLRASCFVFSFKTIPPSLLIIPTYGYDVQWMENRKCSSSNKTKWRTCKLKTYKYFVHTYINTYINAELTLATHPCHEY